MCTELIWFQELGDEPSGSIQDVEIFDLLSVCYFLRKEYSAVNQSVKWVSLG
jgi:hypothetical protein